MKRLQFDFSDEKVKELDNLANRTGLKTRVQLFNSALSLFEWAIREREAGRIIASVNIKTDEYKEVVMPGFPAIKELDIPTFLATRLAAEMDPPRAEASISASEFEQEMVSVDYNKDYQKAVVLLKKVQSDLAEAARAESVRVVSSDQQFEFEDSPKRTKGPRPKASTSQEKASE